jgi:hypothetical protein
VIRTRLPHVSTRCSRRERLQDALLELVPVRGDALAQAALTGSMLAGVLVGLLIADSAIPSDELELPVVPS